MEPIMARNVLNSILSFLSTAVFFATFVLVGDVLVAATAAVATALVQFIVRQSTQHKTGVLMWASLALVLALTGLSIRGDDAFAGTLSQAQMTRQMSGQNTAHVSKCACRVPAGLTQATLAATPTL
jgi:hypothetical protein